MEETDTKISLDETTKTKETDNPLDLECVKEDEQQRKSNMEKLSSLGLNLTREQADKFARLKVRCRVAEGLMPQGTYLWEVETYARKVQLDWCSRKIQRINALYELHQLLRLKVDVTEELKTCATNNKKTRVKPHWSTKLMDFREHIDNRIARNHRTLIFLSQFVDNKEFIREDEEVSGLAGNLDKPIWRPKLMQPNRGRPNKNVGASILDDIVIPLVKFSELEQTCEDLGGVHQREFGSIGEGNIGRIGFEDVGGCKEIKEINVKESTPKISWSYSASDGAEQTPSMTYARVQNQLTFIPISNRASVPPSLTKYYKRFAPFINRNGLNIIRNQPRKQPLTIVGEPITGCMPENVKNKVISVTPSLRDVKSKMVRDPRKVKQDDKMFESGQLFELKTKQSPREDNMTKCVSNRISPLKTVALNPIKERKPKNKISKSTTQCLDEHLKQLCLTRKCVVALERVEIHNL